MRRQSFIEVASMFCRDVCLAGRLHFHPANPCGDQAEDEWQETGRNFPHLFHCFLVSLHESTLITWSANIDSAIICAALTLVYRVKVLLSRDPMWLSAQLFICK